MRRSQDDAVVDVSKELAEIGLSDKAGWYASAALYGAGSLVTIAIGLLDPGLFPPGIMTLALISLVGAGLSLLGARYLVNADWATHTRLSVGLAILCTGALIAGELGPAFVMLPMFTIFTPCYLYGSRFALPYSVVVLILAPLVVAFETHTNVVAHTVIATGTLAMIIASFMISEQRTRSLARLNRRLAYTDPLTGIANTRKLREELTAALDGDRFALFAMDLDNFKLVNDVFDHTVGDDVLKAVARELERELEPGDLVARRGGDEFSVLVPEIEGRDLDDLCDRLAAAIGRARRSVCPSVTPSGSVAYVFADPRDTLASVLQRADDELHHVKQAFHAAEGSREVAAESATRDDTVRRLHVVTDAVEEHRRAGRISLGIAASLRKGAVGVNPLWGYAAATVGPICATGAILCVTGQLRPLSPVSGTLFAVAGIVLSYFTLIAGRRKLDTRLLHPVYIAMLLLFAVEVAIAGTAGAAMFDCTAVLMLSAFFWFRPRAALYYALLAGTVMSTLAVVGHFPFAGVRIAIINTVTLVAAAIVVKVRGITVEFTRMNRELSEIDALTGVANLRALRSRAERAIELAAGGPRIPAIISVDLDKFKNVNDTYNHTTGDQVIVAVARAVSETVRAEDLVARRGGDEFFVLCMTEDEDEIDGLCRRLSEAVVHARSRICPDLMPTASITAIYWSHGEHADELLARADAALHDEKAAKRARGYDRATA